MAITKALYIAQATAIGGREGTAKTDDGQLDLRLDLPKGLGGKGEGTNPEQLFAAGYAACFIGAIKTVAGKQHLQLGAEPVSIDSEVSFGPLAGHVAGFGIAVAMKVHLPGLDREVAEKLVHDAHQVCPYSNATRGNIDVAVSVA